MFHSNKQQNDYIRSKSTEKYSYLSTLIFDLILVSIFATLFVMIYWCSHRERRSKNGRSLTSSHQIEKTRRPIDSPPISFVPQAVEPSENDRVTATPMLKAKQIITKNLLERRGSNNLLTLSITTTHRTLPNPLNSSSIDDCLKTATRRLTIDELHHHAQQSCSLAEEFWAVPSNHLEKLRLGGAGIKNRYETIIANEHSRVQLTEIAGDPVSSYINANYIRAFPDHRRGFIATQGPLTNTIVDFYRMIWQENVPVIVMMTRLIERNQSKCERYIPENENQNYGLYRVRIKSIIYQNDYEIRRLTIEFNNEQREIDHYWYTAWPDQSCPERIQPLIDLVQNVEKSRIELIKTNGPVVVHCSAGVGRTGCFIAIHNGIKQLDQEKSVDIIRILCDLRQDRGGMIQTDDQYQFVYQTLSEYARTIS